MLLLTVTYRVVFVGLGHDAEGPRPDLCEVAMHDTGREEVRSTHKLEETDIVTTVES